MHPQTSGYWFPHFSGTCFWKGAKELVCLVCLNLGTSLSVTGSQWGNKAGLLDGGRIIIVKLYIKKIWPRKIKQNTEKNRELPRFSSLTGRGKIWDPRSCTNPSKDPPAQNYVLANKALKMDIKSLLSYPHRLEVHLTQPRNWSNRSASFGGFRA